MPDYPPQSELLVEMLVICLFLLPISMVVIAVAPVADPWIRLLAIGVVCWFAGLAVEGVRRWLARARGVPFIGEWDYAQACFRWNLAEPLWVQELRMVPVLVVAVVAGVLVIHGAQFWELPLRSWLPWLAMIPLWLVIVAITGMMRRLYWPEDPPRHRWLSAALVAVFLCFVYLNNHPSAVGAAAAVGLITPVVVTRYWISRVT